MTRDEFLQDQQSPYNGMIGPSKKPSSAPKPSIADQIRAAAAQSQQAGTPAPAGGGSGRSGGMTMGPTSTPGMGQRGTYDKKTNPTGQPGGVDPNMGNVGAPNLGTVSELLRWANQIDSYYGNNKGTDYLKSIGMMPNVQTMQVGPGSASGAANQFQGGR